MQRTCKTCKTEQAGERRQADLAKYAEEQRRWRAGNPEAVRQIATRSSQKAKADPEKHIRIKATSLLSWYVTQGRIIKPKFCSECGRKGVVQGHHHDYSKPLDVEWLCRFCHLRRHGKESRMIDPDGIHDVPTEGLTPEWDAELAYLEAIRG